MKKDLENSRVDKEWIACMLVIVVMAATVVAVMIGYSDNSNQIDTNAIKTEEERNFAT